jgi:hypothetical protein
MMGRQQCRPILLLLLRQWAYGTIDSMSDHRIRLTDDDLTLVIAALRARAAMSGAMRRHRIDRLAARLAECTRGNPKYSLGEYEQTHEGELADDSESD